MSRRSVLVAGCGFLGLALARRLHASGFEVLGLTHSVRTAEAMSGEPFPVRACDISHSDELTALAQTRDRKFDVAIHCASSGKGEAEDYRQVYLMGARNLLEALAPAHMIFTSSTSVYAQIGGEWVNEESAAQPKRETGLILREAEETVLAGGGAVLRLSALYGPGRSVLLRKFFNGQAVIEGDGSRRINQIHRDDAVAAYVQVIERAASGLYNVSDDVPISQVALYRSLAERFARPVPPYGEVNLNRKRGVSHKRVANAKLRALGWWPKYPSFFDAIEQDPAIVTAARAEESRSGAQEGNG